MMWPFRRPPEPDHAPSVTDLLLAQREIADLRAEKQRLLVANRQLDARVYALEQQLAPFIRAREARDAATGRFVKRAEA